ncbi:MAG: carboxypeptidase-like regulatory domain-containing protein, partial [Acidobacteriota bacterium]|nr:carboxypeptidase-like regulatory domain-containing protein [Acidobacteriota bacterium]
MRLALTLTLLLTSSAAPAQTPSPASTPLPAQTPPRDTSRVAGTVVSGLSHQPVQHASVTLASTRDNRPVASTTTDESGRFAIDHLPAGAFVLSGEAPGFLRSTYLQHGLFSTAIVTGAAVDTESLVLTLRPLGTLSGTITDESAEPVSNAQVHLFRRDHNFGDSRFVPAATASTNDLGRYEFPRLPPDTYFLAVTAQPWYAVHPTLNPAPPQSYGITGPADPALDVAYPVTFFPVATDQTRAAPIPLTGNAATADIQLSPTPALTLTLPRSPSRNNTPQPIPQ